MRPNNLSAGIEKLFYRYIKAFEARDIQGVRDCYSLPCQISTPNELRFLNSEEAFTSEFDTLFARLGEVGFHHAEPHNASYVALSDGLALVSVSWYFRSNDKTLLTAFCTVYTMVCEQQAWRISSAVSHDQSNYVTLKETLTIGND